MVVRGELFGNFGALFLLSPKELPFAIVPGSKVLGLQLIQRLNHPRDEVLVLPLLHSVDLGHCPFINCERHKCWDGP